MFVCSREASLNNRLNPNSANAFRKVGERYKGARRVGDTFRVVGIEESKSMGRKKNSLEKQ